MLAFDLIFLNIRLQKLMIGVKFILSINNSKQKGGGQTVRVNLIDPYAFRKTLIIKGYSQNKLAKAINLSSPYLNQIINEERFPSGEVAKRIADQLELKFEDIFFINDACKS